MPGMVMQLLLEQLTTFQVVVEANVKELAQAEALVQVAIVKSYTSQPGMLHL